MKAIVISIMCVLGTQAFAQTKETSKDLWLKLSTEVQNLSYQVMQLHPGGLIDPGNLAEDMKPVERALTRLVEEGDLVEKIVHLKSWRQLGDEGVERIQQFIEKLAVEHGHFTAMFLMDMGPSRRFEDDQDPNTPVNLRLRLPAERLREFAEFAADHNLLKSKDAESAPGSD